jgi:hypothetical protein
MAQASTMNPRLLLVRRTASQLLDRRIDAGPVPAVRNLLAVQAQDRMAWRLALRARVSGITAADVDRALTEDRSLLVAWVNRGTLHLIASEDYPWLLGLTAPTQVAANRRRLAQLEFTPDEVERSISAIVRALLDDGPLPRSRIREKLKAQGIRTEGQALVHLLFATVIRGLAVMGPMVGGEHAFAHTREWLGVDPGEPGSLTGKRRDIALAELARRYLRGHGPATDADLAKWAGLPLRDARSGLRAVAAELVELEGGLLDVADRKPSALELEARWLTEPLPPRLLPGFDPSQLGWREREPFVLPADDGRVVQMGGGFFRAMATVDGVAAATWSLRHPGGGVEIGIVPFGALDSEAAAALHREAEDVARFEGRILVEREPIASRM